MTEFLQTIAQLTINGIAVGAIYALVALGIVLIYKATEVLNFAHGDLLVVAAFSAWSLITLWHLPFWLALLCVVLGVALFSYLLDAFIIRRIAGQPQFSGVMLTIALAFMIRGAVSMIFGPESRLPHTLDQSKHALVWLVHRQFAISDLRDLDGGYLGVVFIFQNDTRWSCNASIISKPISSLLKWCPR